METQNSAKDGKPGLNIRILPEHEGQIELMDDMNLPDVLQNGILESYLDHLYDDLSNRSLPVQGISKPLFLEVK